MEKIDLNKLREERYKNAKKEYLDYVSSDTFFEKTKEDIIEKAKKGFCSHSIYFIETWLLNMPNDEFHEYCENIRQMLQKKLSDVFTEIRVEIRMCKAGNSFMAVW